jgi:large subunit ribosomal protein L18e
MVKLTGPTNYQLKELLVQLDAQPHQNHFWKRIAEDLRRPTRERRIVNVYKIEKFAQDGETIVVPGKVLSVGDLTKKVNVAALTFSDEAKKKIENAKGKALSIQELLKNNPEGKQVRILG